MTLSCVSFKSQDKLVFLFSFLRKPLLGAYFFPVGMMRLSCFTFNSGPEKALVIISTGMLV